jgi:hypothetical protein
MLGDAGSRRERGAMGTMVSEKSIGPVRALIALMVFLAAAVLSIGGAKADEWTKIDCASADARVVPPAGIQADCYNGPEDKGGSQNCTYFRYSASAPAGANEPRFYLQFRASPNPQRCGLVLSRSPTEVLQHAAKFVEDEATNWSALQSIDADTQAMFFDAKNQKREGKCFGFTKLGPLMSATARTYTLFGYFCKAPGQALDAGAAAAMVKGIQIKS